MGIWPDNLKTVNVFISMSTQWRTGMKGVIGLDYNVLPMVLEVVGVSPEEKSEVFDGLRVMEDAALEVMRGNKDE